MSNSDQRAAEGEMRDGGEQRPALSEAEGSGGKGDGGEWKGENGEGELDMKGL
jgi:hypothetical protein